ncbi:glycosyltransferase family 4 protein [Thalassospira lucentensis]|uniref:glycosyltransferase family 4 protein n=1 Tax=Thalassospira lucentensis TaxID=168935 RepID=UPI00294391FF|nr:glycosyltransferase family 4 protein [Thalassospira lucentensis]WOI11251.1 glycosyltransferase family 4 protein [Thalassospira lucentensis]
MLTILHLTHKSNMAGGGEKSMIELALEQQKSGLMVSVVCSDGEIESLLERNGISFRSCPAFSKISSLSFEKKWNALGKFLDIINSAWRLSSIIKSIKSDVLHFHTILSLFCAVPYLIFNGSKQKVVYHHRSPTSIRRIKFIMCFVDSIVLISKKEFNVARNLNLSARLYHIPNAVNAAIVGDGNVSNEDIVRVAIPAAIKPLKRQEDAVDFVKFFAERYAGEKAIEFTIRGRSEDVEYLSMIQEKSKKYGLDHILSFVVGELTTSELFDSVDIALFFSRTETFGRVVAEAMSAGVAVISEANDGAFEIIDDGVNGFIINRDFNRLYEILIHLLIDKSALKKIKTAGQQTWNNRFQVSILARRIETVYRETEE